MAATGAAISVAFNSSNNLNLGTNLGNQAFNANAAFAATFATIGAGAGGFNTLYMADLTVTAASPVSLDLIGSLKQPDGSSSAVFADICAILIINRSTTTGQNLLIGGGSNDVTTIWGSTGVQTLLPGMVFLLGGAVATGYALVASTADLLKIDVAAGTAVPFTIAIIGH